MFCNWYVHKEASLFQAAMGNLEWVPLGNINVVVRLSCLAMHGGLMMFDGCFVGAPWKGRSDG